MNKYILTIAASVLGIVSSSSVARAQAVVCPYGYTCTPIVQMAVVCPYGFTCTPINSNYPPISSYPSYPTYPTPTYPTYPTYPSNNNAGPLRIISPNGGEVWQTGTAQTIAWTSPAYFSATYADLKLIRTTPFCTGMMMCPMIAYAPYTIASNISINQNSYNWIVSQVPDGQYTVQICVTGTSNCDSSDSSFTVSSYGTISGGQTPIISGIDAPTTLAVGQVGTWTVHATDPQNGTMNYSVDWGDQAISPYGLAMAASSNGQFVQTTTFTHTYNTTGTFTVTFTVRNASGLTAQSKTTVYVGNTANQQPLTVISPNGGEVWKRGTQQNISWSTQNTIYPYYLNNTNSNTGYVRITLDYRCPTGVYCTALYRPTYIVQNSASNSGTSLWYVGSATIDGVNAVSVPSGTYVITVCRYDNSTQPLNCASSNSAFTLTD